MLTVRQLPRLVTPALWGRLARLIYDREGRSSLWICDGPPLPDWLAEVALAVCPDVPAEMWAGVLVQGYRNGVAVTPCHADLGHRISFILSLGETRTVRFHRVPDGAVGCGDYDLDVVRLECVAGTAVIMDEEFHRRHHHQVVPDPGAGERISLVFRGG